MSVKTNDRNFIHTIPSVDSTFQRETYMLPNYGLKRILNQLCVSHQSFYGLKQFLLDEIEPCMSPQEIGRFNLSNVVFSTTWISISLIVLLYAYFILSTIINPNVFTFSPHFNSMITLQHSTNHVQLTKMVTNISCT